MNNDFDAENLSIHAPTRGATFHRPSRQVPVLSFNPRSYKRSDKKFHHMPIRILCFQSTLLQEERLESPLRTTRSKSFQSTLLQEERPGYTIDLKTGKAFNPRSYKRSDNIRNFSIISISSFNPRSYKRSD